MSALDDRGYRWVSVALLGGVVLALYGYTLQLLFFYDDLPIFSWLMERSFLDIWWQTENVYFRPLTFVVYKLGLLLPVGLQAPVLHSVNLIWHFLGAVLVQRVVLLYRGDRQHAFLAGLLYAAFPLVTKAIPWITAMGHPMAALLVLGAVYFALRAEAEGRPLLWGLSFLATFLAPFAHESGIIAGVVVGGVVWMRYGIRRLVWPGALGGVLNVLGLLIHPAFSAPATFITDGLYAKAMVFLQSLVYPLAPTIGWLGRTQGWQDFLMLDIAGVVLALLLVALTLRKAGNARWIGLALWWWFCGALPAMASKTFDALYVAPRLTTLGSAGPVILWAGIAVELGRLLDREWWRVAATALMVVIILAQGVSYVAREATLTLRLDTLFRDALDVVVEEENHPIGFVNLPYHLSWQETTHPLARDGVVFVPWYSGLSEFIYINLQRDVVEVPSEATYGPVMEETDPIWGVEGEWLDVEQIYAFLQEQRTIWLTVLGVGDTLALREVGAITRTAPFTPVEALVDYEGGPRLLSAQFTDVREGQVDVTLWWASRGPVGAEIFVHVRDATGEVIAQADGPALGGLAPIWTWQAGDFLRDVRTISLPSSSIPPYRVQVGVYNGEGRFPAYLGSQRAPEDAPTVVLFHTDE
jgi:hypothetical protein